MIEKEPKRRASLCNSLGRIPEVEVTNISRATAINRGQLQRLIKITRATSRYADRDVLVIMLGHESIDSTQRYLDLSPAILNDMFANALL